MHLTELGAGAAQHLLERTVRLEHPTVDADRDAERRRVEDVAEPMPGTRGLCARTTDVQDRGAREAGPGARRSHKHPVVYRQGMFP
jgi:hypothetical protein